jgi:hypothetical protein
MTNKVLSLLSILFSLLAAALFFVGQRRGKSNEEMYALEGRIKGAVPMTLDTYGERLAKFERVADELQQYVGAQPAAGGSAPLPTEADPVLRQEVDRAFDARRTQLRDLLTLRRTLSANPNAEALLWRKTQEQTFGEFAKTELGDKLKLEGDRFNKAKELLLQEYFRVQGMDRTPEDGRIRAQTDLAVQNAVYPNDPEGYRKYLDWRKVRERLRRSGR